MKQLGLLLFFVSGLVCTALAQEFFDIRHYDIDVRINQDASIDVKEKIDVRFFEPRHGIFRKIPFRYRLSSMPEEMQQAEIPWQSKGYRYTKIENISVERFRHEEYEEGEYKTIKIGSKDQWVNGDQTYEISYRLIGAINFFSDFSEFYLNLIGNAWPVPVHRVHYRVQLYKPLEQTPGWFVATGAAGSKEDISQSAFKNNEVLEGEMTQVLQPYEGMTVGIRMPAGFLSKPDYRWMGRQWMMLPLVVLVIMFLVWRKWGKDLPVTVTTEFYPPEGVSPSVAGYVIDGKLDRRDLTALIPFWGAGGYIRVEETEKKKFLGLLKDSEFTFVKLKDLPASVPSFEKIMFDGLFDYGTEVKLSDLKDSFYTTMNRAKKSLESEITGEGYYVKYTRTFSAVLPIAGLILLILSIINLFSNYPLDVIFWSSLAVSSLFVVIFGALMEKKTRKGTELFQKLLGFKEFIKSVEKDRLKEFLKQDENYFDKVLPFAIVFNIADTWKDKLKGLEVPPPGWYSGYYAGQAFNTSNFMNSLDKGMDAMSHSFFSAPSSSGSSGGSFGGGGFSGGGFGGGGGGSW